jgi:hypothetical protein
MTTATKTATVHDLTPARLRRLVEQQETTAAAHGIFADMADGVLVAQEMLNLWGYEWDEAKFALLIIGLCGDSDEPVAMFDPELAEHARCTDRTIQRWRKAHLQKVRLLKSGPLIIKEGEYDAGHQRYARTTYAIVPELRAAIARAVAEARALPDYATDRRAALQRTAKENYRDLPDVPPPGRRRSPRSSRRSPAVQHLNRAKKALERSKTALKELNDLQRAAVFACEGKDMRSTLEAMKAEIAQLLSTIPANDDSAQVDDMHDKMSGIPPVPEHTPADVENFERQMARAVGAPAVRSVALELVPPDPPPRVPSCEELEADAIRAEACGQ